MSEVSDDDDNFQRIRDNSLNTTDLSEKSDAVPEDQRRPSLTILDGTFFQIDSETLNNKTVVATCVKCSPKLVKIKGLLNSTSNYVSHLKRKHGEETVAEYHAYATQKKCRKRNDTSSSEDSSSSCSNQITQANFEKDLRNFFVHSMIPLNVVEDPFFALMLNNLELKKHGLNLISRRTLTRKITESKIQEVSRIKSELEEAENVCTVVDIWSCRKRSFFGMTVHWLDSELNRKSKTLACRRFAGTHNYERIAMLIEEIHKDFGLSTDKIEATVTDNGSNFVKAFKEFGLSIESMEDFDSDSEEDVSNGSHENFEEQENILPSHLRCAAHTLNLCAVSDANKLLKKDNNSTLSEIHHKTVEKCNVLWNAAGRPKTAEIIQDVLGHTLSRPGVTRWNSLYDAMKQIYSIKEKNIMLHRALSLTNFISDREIEYMKEYIRCSAPIAEALDILQGETNMYYGLLLPCLMALRKKLRKLQNASLKYCEDLVNCYKESVEKRFEEFFYISTGVAERAAVAALSYPRFKNKWFTCVTSHDQERIKMIFKHVITREISKTNDNNGGEDPVTNTENPFFDFGSDSDSETDTSIQVIQQRITPKTRAEIMMTQFFAESDCSLMVLNRYDEIKKIFKKYNTPLPSSASVERMFSYATMVNLPKSNRLSDNLFEDRVVLKTNLKM